MYKINNFNKKKILVAGGSGLLGANITNLLLQTKAKVVSSYHRNYLNFKKKFYKKFNFLNFEECLKATKNKDIVFITAVKASGMFNLEKNFFKQNLNNLKLRINLLEACKINKVKKVVWVSSSTIYQPLNKPIKENELNLNLNPYEIYSGDGTTYRYLEDLFMYYSKNFNMNIKIVRTASIYGPYDNFDINYSHVIPGLIKKVLSKNKFLEVYGNPLVTRDFVYVKDLALATILLSKHKFNGIINFSSGIPTTISQLSKKIIKASNSKKKIRFINKKKSSAIYRVLDNSKFNNIFKKFKRTNLNRGLTETIEWYVNNKK